MLDMRLLIRFQRSSTLTFAERLKYTAALLHIHEKACQDLMTGHNVPDFVGSPQDRLVDSLVKAESHKGERKRKGGPTRRFPELGPKLPNGRWQCKLCTSTYSHHHSLHEHGRFKHPAEYKPLTIPPTPTTSNPVGDRCALLVDGRFQCNLGTRTFARPNDVGKHWRLNHPDQQRALMEFRRSVHRTPDSA